MGCPVGSPARATLRVMDLSELTPELFEKAEFAERRRGYDIDQVERFLEETGTAVAQLLVKHRQLEERAAHAESRLAEIEAQGGTTDVASAPAAPGRSEVEEVEQATSTLMLARRTADAAVAEAHAQSQQIRAEARSSAERMLAEARAQADSEMVAGRGRVVEVVNALETRRDSLKAVVEEFERRISGYRSELSEVATSLTSMVSDPEGLGPRPEVTVPADAVGRTEPSEARLDLTDATRAHDSTMESPGPWQEGSWSEAAGSGSGSGDSGGQSGDLPPSTDAEDSAGAAVLGRSSTKTADARAVEPVVIVDAEPATGQTSDRFLRELDEAVNESERGSDAIDAFFEEDDEPGRPRFGWRR